MGDLIDKQKVIDICNRAIDLLNGELGTGAMTAVRDWIVNLPFVQPERKTGKWMHGREIAREMTRDCTTAIFYDGWICSECGCLVEKEREPLYKYCPNCGADMRGEQDE